MIVLVQLSFHTTWASLFEMELEMNLLDWNGNKLEQKLELEDMKPTQISFHLSFSSNPHISMLEKWIPTYYVGIWLQQPLQAVSTQQSKIWFYPTWLWLFKLNSFEIHL